MGMQVRDGHMTTIEEQICPHPCLIGLMGEILNGGHPKTMQNKFSLILTTYSQVPIRRVVHIKQAG